MRRTGRSPVVTVLVKELRDHARDRRSMMSGVLVPIFWPVLFGVLFSFIASWLSQEQPLRLLVQGAANAPSFTQFLVRQGVQVVPAPANYEQLIRDGDEDVALVIPEDFARHFSDGRPASVEVVGDGSRNKARTNIERAEHLVQLYGSEMGALRLLARGVSPSLVQAVKMERRDLATKEKQAANFLYMIPVMVLLSAFLGGMHVAIDSTAGERERGSLEPLLLNPAPLHSLVLGKWLSTVLMAAAGVLITLTGFAIMLRVVHLEDLGMRASLAGNQLGLMALTLLPLVCFTGALQLLVATFAHSFKEAQTYLSMVQFVPSMPGMVLAFMPFKTHPWMYAVPAFGQQLLMADIMRGELTKLTPLLTAGVGTGVAAVLCLVALTRLLRNEGVIFGR